MGELIYLVIKKVELLSQHYFVSPVKPFVLKHLNLVQLSVGYGLPALHFLDYYSCFPMSLYFKYVSQRIHDFHFI